MIPVSTSVLMVILKPLRFLAAVQGDGSFNARSRVNAKQRRAKNVKLFLANLSENKAD